MAATPFTKQPRETRRIDLSFRRHLNTAGDEPLAVEPASVSVDPPASVAAWLHQDGVVTAWVEGGVNGRNCPGSAILKTAGGEVLELDFVVRVREL